ncbi:MAG: universal stress protein [Variovorax sp.]|nr:universal stress protein [Variovorax sp.]
MYQRILVPIDGSSTSGEGLAEAIRLAKLTGGRLRLVHILDELSFALGVRAYAGQSADWLEGLRATAVTLLENARAQALAEGVEADTVLRDGFKAGAVHDQVVAEASDSQADLIVLGTHGRRGLSRWAMGSNAEHILRMAPVPVLLIRAPEIAAKVDYERFSLPDGLVANQ